MNKWNLIGAIIMFSMLGFLVFGTWYGVTHPNFYSIYKATLPFGIIQVEGSFFIGTGRIGVEEIYYIKYWNYKNELVSLNIRADLTPIVVDGTFQLEQRFLGNYRVHIPKLPEVNQTWTMEWIR